MEQVLNKPVTPVLHFSPTVEGSAPKICVLIHQTSLQLCPPQLNSSEHGNKVPSAQQLQQQEVVPDTKHWMRKPGVWCWQSSFLLGALKEPTCSMYVRPLASRVGRSSTTVPTSSALSLHGFYFL